MTQTRYQTQKEKNDTKKKMCMSSCDKQQPLKQSIQKKTHILCEYELYMQAVFNQTKHQFCVYTKREELLLLDSINLPKKQPTATSEAINIMSTLSIEKLWE